MHKIFNRNTVKISNSCKKNIGSIILAHNQNILNPTVKSCECNCRVRSSRPFNGECFTPKVIYTADIPNNVYNDKRFYFALVDTPFK